MKPHRWRALARNRILRILKARQVASIRQLESKISESGPFPMRAEPHHLKSALDKLIADGDVIEIAKADKTRLFARSSFDTSKDSDSQRLEFILKEYNKYLNVLTSPTGGLPLETVVQASIESVGPSLHWFGSAGRIPTGDIFDGRSFTGQGKLDHLILESGTDLVGVEDKNIREWIYPRSPLIRTLLKKCVLYGITPLLITRRLPFISRTFLSSIGVLAFQTYYQYLPPDLSHSLQHARHKDGLGFHDIRFSYDPLPTLVDYLRSSLHSLLPIAQRAFQANLDLITAYAVEESLDFDHFFNELLPLFSPES